MPNPTPASDLKRQMQRELFRLVLSIVAVDAIAIVMYSLAGMDQRDRTTRLVFTVLWVAATLLVVVPGLRKMKRLRMRLRRGV
jgi:hypothetical protein